MGRTLFFAQRIAYYIAPQLGARHRCQAPVPGTRLSSSRAIAKGSLFRTVCFVAFLLAMTILAAIPALAAEVQLTTTSTTVQIDVPNRYRAVMDTVDDTDPYALIQVYDRLENDTAPDWILAIDPPIIKVDGVEYSLNYYAERATTILEATSVRVRIRVEGFLEDASDNHLTDGTNKITAVGEYTFNSQGIQKQIEYDLQDGISFDNVSDQLFYVTCSFNEDGSDYYSETIFVGDGHTESSSNGIGGAVWSGNSLRHYMVLPALNSYQDILVGVHAKGHVMGLPAASTAYYESGDPPYGVWMVDGGQGTGTLAGKVDSQTFCVFRPQADLDTEAEREALFNDLTNPDLPPEVKRTPGLEFDGGDYVALGNSASFNLTNLTVTAWMWSPDPTGSTARIVVGKAVDTNDRWGIRLSDGTLKIYDGINARNAEVGVTYIDANTWYHVAATMTDNGDGTFENKFYVDGLLKGSGSNSTDSWASGLGNANVAIGVFASGAPHWYYTGRIDDVRVYDRVLSQDEIRRDMYREIDPATPGLVAYCKFNEATGQDVLDETTNNNDGTLGADSGVAVDDPTWTHGRVPSDAMLRPGQAWHDAPGAGALDFDGSDDYVFVGNPADGSLDVGMGEISVGLWVRSSKYDQLVLDKKEAGTNDAGYNLYVGSSGNWVFRVANGSSQVGVTAFPAGLALDNQWHHVTGILERGSTDYLRIYVDGILNNSNSNTAGWDIDSTYDFVIGDKSNLGATVYRYEGSMDDVFIYGRALTGPEIMQIMQDGVDLTDPDLMAYWPMNEAQGQEAADLSLNRNHGRLGATTGSDTTDPVWITGGVPTPFNEAEGAYTFEAENNDNFGLEFERDNSETVLIEDTPELSALDTLTVTAWIKPESINAADQMTVLSHFAVDSGNREFQYNVDTDGGIQWATGGGGGDHVYSVQKLVPGNWYHVAGTYDITGPRQIFINGKLDKEDNWSRTSHNATGPMCIGVRWYNNGGTINQWFDGIIDEVRLYNRVLSESEIQASMNRHVDLNSGEALGLVGYWRLDESRGQIVQDSSGYGHYGYLGEDSSSESVDPVWAAGYEGVKTAAANNLTLDLDGATGVSNDLNGAVAAGDTSVTLTSSSGFPASGIAYIEEDKFSYSAISTNDLTGIPEVGDLALNAGHADAAVVSLAPRHNPAFKVRKWRSLGVPQTLTLGGSTLSRGTDYEAAIKPVTAAYFADNLLWHSTLDSATAVTSPDVGSAGTVSGADFVTALYGKAARFNADQEDINFPTANNFNKAKGSLEFWYQPNYSSTTTTISRAACGFSDAIGDHAFSVGYFGSDQGFSGELGFIIRENAATRMVYFANSAYSWNAGDWVHIRAEWDDSLSSEDLNLYLNGEKATSRTADGQYNSANLTVQSIFCIGNTRDAGIAEAQGVIDEFRIYGGSSTAPTQIAAGGDKADTNEYLADSSRNTTLDFNETDASARGEYLYLGSESRFTGINTDLATAGVGTVALTWEYWNGSDWSNLVVQETTTGAKEFKASGCVYWVDPPDWQLYSVNGSTDLYYVRVHIANGDGDFTADPIEEKIMTDILVITTQTEVTAADTEVEMTGGTPGGGTNLRGLILEDVKVE